MWRRRSRRRGATNFAFFVAVAVAAATLPLTCRLVAALSSEYDFSAPFHLVRDGRVVSRRQLLEDGLEPAGENIDCDANRVCCTHDGVCACQEDEYQRADHQCVPYTPKNPDGVRCDYGVCDEHTAVLGEWQCDDRLVEPHIYVPRNCNGSYSPSATDYTTCKAARRCNWARQYYDVVDANYTMTRISFDAGRVEEVELFNDFEDWFGGTHGWTHTSYVAPPEGVFSTFEIALLGPLDLLEGELQFNTTSATANVAGNEVQGEILLTTNGTEVAVFNFDYIYLEDEVEVTLTGNRAISILSRSSIYFNTRIELPPGELGAFEGSVYVQENDVNGPGGGSVRVYLWTIRTSADDVDEVQVITTSARHGQNIRGGFFLTLDGERTAQVAHDATPAELKSRLEELPNLSEVTVARSRVDEEGGYSWTITFDGEIGDVNQLEIENMLTGIDADITIYTAVEGNDIGGNFTVSFFNETTRDLAHNVSAEAMAEALMEDLSPYIQNAVVSRTDPLDLARCDYGYCANGPTPGYGYTWTLILTTFEGNVQPTSPTSPLFDVVDPPVNLTVSNDSLTGQGVAIEVMEGHQATVNYNNLDVLYVRNLDHYFTLSWGGAGGSYGGQGGEGRGYNAPGFTYNDETLSDLLAGSAGTPGGPDLRNVVGLLTPNYRGGSGGGMIEITALNDIVFGPEAVLDSSGEPGAYGYWGGGGGSGGGIRLAAGGTITNYGTLTVRGGDGGGCPADGGSPGSGGGGGRIAVFAQSLSDQGDIILEGGSMGPINGTSVVDGGLAYTSVWGEEGSAAVEARSGGNGTKYYITKMGVQYYVDRTTGVFGTSAALVLRGGEVTRLESGVSKLDPYILNGPRVFVGDNAQPDRATYFVRIGPPDHGTKDNNWGAYFALHGDTWEDDLSTVIGVALVNGDFRHGSNFAHTPGEAHMYLSTVFYENVLYNVWYKVDIQIYWATLEYDIVVDDVLMVNRATFRANSIRAVGVYNYHSMTTWFDEIYLGKDDDMSFICPQMNVSGTYMNRPEQSEWDSTPLYKNEDWEVIRHKSHLSRRNEYLAQNYYGGLIPSDGGPHSRKFVSDFTVRPTFRPGYFTAGALLYVPEPEDPLRDGGIGPQGRWYWYGDHDGSNSPGASDDEDPQNYLYGGIASCSTTDFIHWKNEGVMLHFRNISDQWGNLTQLFIAQRPKVIYNNVTERYVMWFQVEDKALRNYGAAAVATSTKPNGPYIFHRTFYPDGNWTKDLAAFKLEDGSAYLVRTYFADVEYRLPEPVMQPIWESVKDHTGDVDYSLNYHRAFYHEAYDDYHDIYVQRWRLEDKNWNVTYADKVTGELTYTEWSPTSDQSKYIYSHRHEMLVNEHIAALHHLYTAFPEESNITIYANCSDPYAHPPSALECLYTGTFTAQDLRSLIADACCNRKSITPLDDGNDRCCNLLDEDISDKLDILEVLLDHAVMNPAIVPGDIELDLTSYARYIPDGSYYTFARSQKRTVYGQGALTGAVDSRFIDPKNMTNSYWMPSSVPAVKAQPWYRNYLDGNIADNPPHHTPPDKLIGPQTLVETRRTKYISITQLNDEYTRLTGRTRTYEGDLEDDKDLIDLVMELGQFNWNTEGEVREHPELGPGIVDSTNPLPVDGKLLGFHTAPDWFDRFHQYRHFFNDRINDPVNFKNELTEGNV